MPLVSRLPPTPSWSSSASLPSAPRAPDTPSSPTTSPAPQVPPTPTSPTEDRHPAPRVATAAVGCPRRPALGLPLPLAAPPARRPVTAVRAQGRRPGRHALGRGPTRCLRRRAPRARHGGDEKARSLEARPQSVGRPATEEPGVGPVPGGPDTLPEAAPTPRPRRGKPSVPRAPRRSPGARPARLLLLRARPQTHGVPVHPGRVVPGVVTEALVLEAPARLPG